MEKQSRRSFVAQAAGAVAGLTVVSKADAAPNEVIRTAVVGINGRGEGHMYDIEKVPGAQVAALCDVDANILGRRAEEFAKKTGRKPKLYRDIRELCADPDIDAVSIATPNHWHSLMGIWAMMAGKDVYVEKPCSHNIWEGRRLVEVAREKNRMCQHGTQARSAAAVREAIRKLREGVIGEIYMARGLCFKRRPSIGTYMDENPPAGVDYNLWLGPAPLRPFNRNRFHYNWHWHWDYGNGDIGNQGVHEMDLARWGLGVGLPRKVQSMGGHFLFDDAQETPNTLVSTFLYPEVNKMLVFEVRHWHSNTEAELNGGKPGNTTGVIFYGSEGYMALTGGGYRVYLGSKAEPGPKRSSSSDPFGTFFRAVRSRKREDLGVDIEEGHLSSALCHLGNIAYRLGRTLEFDPKTEQFVGDDAANRLLTREYRSPFAIPATTQTASANGGRR